MTSLKHLSRATRRTIVTVMYAVYVGLWLYWTWLPDDLSSPQRVLVPWFTSAGILLFFVGFYLLYAATGRLADHWKPVSNKALDERQLYLRNRAYFWAYILLGVGASVVFWNTVIKFGFFGALVMFAALYGTLPTAVIAWLEPDPLRDDETEAPVGHVRGGAR